jgi:hypothetical protein
MCSKAGTVRGIAAVFFLRLNGIHSSRRGAPAVRICVIRGRLEQFQEKCEAVFPFGIAQQQAPEQLAVFVDGELLQ